MAGDESKDRVTAVTAIAAIIISLVSFGFTLFWNSPVGDVQPLEPTDIGIVRGLKWDIEGAVGHERLGKYPSDHIVMPMSWQNSSGSSVLIRAPKLVLEEFTKDPDDGGKPTGKKHSLLLYGEYPEVNITAFAGIESKPPAYRGSLILEPHSVSQNLLVFRVMGFEGDNRNFRIKGNTHYGVSVKYEQIPTIETLEVPKGFHWSFLHIAGRDTKTEELIPDWHTFNSVDCLQLYGDPVKPEDINPDCERHQWYRKHNKTVRGGFGWTYRSLVPGARY